MPARSRQPATGAVGGDEEFAVYGPNHRQRDRDAAVTTTEKGSHR